MKERLQVLDEFALKVIAILTMTIDHIGFFLIQYSAAGSPMSYCGQIFKIIGRIAFPLFVFMLAEGMSKSKDRANYLLRLALLWLGITIGQTVIISVRQDYPYMFAQAFTDLLCYASFVFFMEKKGLWKMLSILPLAYIILSFAAQVSEQYAATSGGTVISAWSRFFPEWIRCGYSLLGFLMFLGMYYAKPLIFSAIKKIEAKNEVDLSSFLKGKKYQGFLNSLSAMVIILTTVIFWGLSYLLPRYDPFFSREAQSYCVLAIIPLIMYNGARGYDAKWFRYFSYLYYPVHIILIAVIFTLIF